jgi:hypothetical protein
MFNSSHKSLTSLFILTSILFSTHLYAKVIQVLPGHNTLTSALTQVDNGDTVVLVDGIYTTDTNLSIDKSVTIRSIIPAIIPVLSGVYITFSGTGSYAIVQGLRFSYRASHSCGFNLAGQVGTAVNNVFNSNCQVTLTSSAKSGDKSFVGNTLSASILSFGTGAVVAGNNFYSSGSGFITGQTTQVNGSSSSASPSYVIGNNFSCNMTGGNDLYCESIYLGGDSGYIIANRFNQTLTGNYSLNSISSYVVKTTGSLHKIYSNIIHYKDGDKYFTGAKKISPIIVGAGVVDISNNIIHVTGNMPSPIEESAAITIAVGSVGRVQNNIVSNFPDIALKTNSSDVELVYNLCHNNDDEMACDSTKGNLTMDPLFTDTTDFNLATGSPAINAGDPALHLSDIDGTRADMGIHGGRFGFDQYDDQRIDSDKPYIYPLFADVNLTNINEVVVKAISIARFK